ncbi:hypothetical protein L7F22_061158 [Adiantum nelumboides]|nr:hypothetical protein [Adiantum nelumboides]
MSRSQMHKMLLAEARSNAGLKGRVPTSLQLMSPREGPAERVERVVAENAVVIFSVSTCCMCHVAKKLFCSMGVNPSVVELDQESGGADMERALLAKLLLHGADLQPRPPSLPAIFVGGQLIGGLDRLMACHISGALIPLLKEAGALWL